MKNICRPFTVYSDFLPPAKESRDWQYLSFGYFDGVNVGHNLFESGDWDLEKMWHYTETQKAHLNGSFTEQTIFGFRAEEDEDGKDEKFWEAAKGEEYPFLFLVLLQDEHRGEELTALWRSRTRLETTLSLQEGVNAISYLTLDSSDLLLVLACREYSIGAELIDSFHTGNKNTALCENGWNLCYSYTIPSVRKDFLNSSKKIAGVKGILDSVYIHVIEKWTGSIENVYRELYNRWPEGTEKKAVLGCNDDLIVMKKVPWSLFLTFYQDNTGLLNHSCCVYQDNIVGVTTILGEKEKQRNVAGKRERQYGDDAVTLSSILRKECKGLELGEMSGSGRAVRKGLLSVINSLEKYEKALFNDYIFLSALKPMKLLIEMVQEVDKEEDEEKYNHFYNFLTSFNMYTQNSVRSDRQFTEVPDFNIRIYDMPARMHAFYNAIIYDLKTILNAFKDKEEQKESPEKKHEYEFLTCPGVVNNMQVREVYPELIPNKRLFLVDIPEKQVYSPKLMFTMLSHEISHFVGRGIRMRKFRYNCMTEMLAFVYMRYLQQKLAVYTGESGHFEAIAGKDYWETFKNEIAAQLKRYMKWEKEDEFINERFTKGSFNEVNRDWWKERLKLYAYHSDMLMPLMEDHMNLICQERRLFAYLLKKEFLYQIQLGKSGEEAKKAEKGLEEYLIKCGWEFCEFSEWNPSDLNLHSLIEKMMYLLKECFADLGAVMLLHLSVEEYLEAILFSAQDQGIAVETLIDQRDDIVRGALLCLCMVNDEEDCPQIWSLDEVFAMTGKNQELKKLADALWGTMRIYVNGYDEELVKNPDKWDLLYDNLVLEEVLYYLVECRRNYYSQFNEAAEPVQKGILDMFRAFTEKNIELVIEDIQKYIDVYKNKLEVELSNCIEDTQRGA